jgi:hypothetical protein
MRQAFELSARLPAVPTLLSMNHLHAANLKGLAEAESLFADLWAAIEQCRPVQARKRQEVAAVALLSLMFEHCSAIVELLGGRWTASATALLRPMCDAYLRGRWLLHCATEAQLDKVIAKDEFPPKGTMFQALQERGPASHKENATRLDELSGDISDTLHSLTHGGLAQMKGRVHSHGIQAQVSDELFSDALTVTMTHGALGVALLWEIYEDEEFEQKTLAMLIRAKLVKGA